MELAWQWREYGINITILRKKAQSRTKRAEAEHTMERIVTSPGAEKAHTEHLLASGSRYVGPVR
ncbi:MAG TPA: hypothetical protein VMW58_08295 [Anaerolineae bacterium]|nr:hypothetical protein [Anaerolineae bacterium]